MLRYKRVMLDICECPRKGNRASELNAAKTYLSMANH
jgi:hypothetical protein